MASILKHLRSSTADKRPTASGLADGQIALNTASGTPAMFFKDSAGNIVKVGPAHIGTTAPNASPAGSAGNSDGELWIDESLTTRGLKYYDGATFINLTPSGTTSTVGLVELATDAETQAGTDNVRAVTPSGLQSKISDSTATTSSTTIASSTAVKSAYDLANAALPKSGGTLTGELLISPSGSLVFEGSSDDSFETTIAVTNPTADRTITFPNVTGNVVTTGDSGTVTSTMIADGTIVDADINAAAAITHSKLANITAGSVLLGNASNVPTATALSGDVTINSSGVTAISAGVIVNADINASAAIVDTKLDTISTADKVSLSALNIDGATDIGGALENGDLFVVDDGAGGTNRKAQAFRMAQLTYSGVTGDITVASGGTAAISAGVIVNADVNASAAIAGTKISPDFGSQNVTTTGTVTGASLIPTSSTAPTNGVYLPAANSVAISTGGSGRLFVDASGNVSIGTQSAAAPLVVTTTSGPNIRTIRNNKFFDIVANYGGLDQRAHIYSDSGMALTFGTNGDNERLRITSAGLVGIGTSSPAALLEVRSATTNAARLRVTGTGTTAGNFRGYEFGNGSVFKGGLLQDESTDLISIFTPVGGQSVNITSAGSVGIGTTSPTATLEVKGGQIVLNTTTANSSAVIYRINDVTKGYIGPAGILGGSDNDMGYRVESGNNQVFYIGASERARLDSSGRLLVGTSSAATMFSGASANLQAQNTSSTFAIGIERATNDTGAGYIVFRKTRSTSSNGVTVVQSGDSIGNLTFAATDGTNPIAAAVIEAQVDGTPGTNDMPGRLVFSTTRDGQSSPTEAMRITQAGKLILNDTSTAFSARFGITANLTNDNGLLIKNSVAQGSGQNFIAFVNSTNNDAGAIVHNGTGTVNYATSSDYRLKENVVPINDGITRLQQLKPSRFNFIADAGRIVDGFLAHEVQDIVPEAVTGDKDALNENGSIKAQGIDQSKLVPLLTAALQEAVAKIESLEARLTAAGI